MCPISDFFYEHLGSFFKYSADNVNKVLKLRLQEANLTECGIFPLAAIDPSEKILAEFLKEATDKKEHSKYPIRTLLIPHLISGVGIVVRFKDNEAKNVEYYDSKSDPSKSSRSDILREIKEIYGHDINIIEPTNSIKDDSNSAPCIIENLINAAKQDYSDNRSVTEFVRLI